MKLTVAALCGLTMFIAIFSFARARGKRNTRFDFFLRKFSAKLGRIENSPWKLRPREIILRILAGSEWCFINL